MNINNTRIAALILKQLTDTITADECKELNNWLEVDPLHLELYERIVGGESTRWHHEHLSQLSPEENIMIIRSKIDRRKRRQLLKKARVSIAAAVAMLFIVFLVSRHSNEEISGDQPLRKTQQTLISVGEDFTFIVEDEENQTEWKKYAFGMDSISGGQFAENVMIEVRVPNGVTYRLALDDGTEVVLNAGSVLTYPRIFENSVREVALSGEALFNVAWDSERPFTVSIDTNTNIRVVGTTFNVKNYADEAKSAVTLIGGTVILKSYTESVVMKPNDQTVIDKTTNSIELKKLDDTRIFTYWTENKFFMYDSPLSDIFKAMERWYDIRIESDIPMNVTNLQKFSVSASSMQEYTHILDALGKVIKLQYVSEIIEGVHIVYVNIDEI